MDGVSAVIKGRAPPLPEDMSLTPISEALPGQILLTLREMSRRNRTSSNENLDVWGIYCVQCWFAALHFGGFTLAAWRDVRFHKKHRGELEGLYEDTKLAAEQLRTLLDEECEERCQSLPK